MEKMHIALQPAVTNLRASWILPDGYDVIYTPEHIRPLFEGDRLTLYAILARRKDLEATSNGKRSRRSSSESVKEFWFEVLKRYTDIYIFREWGSSTRMLCKMGKNQSIDIMFPVFPQFGSSQYRVVIRV